MADNLPDVYIRFMDSGSPPKPLFDGDSLDEAYPGKGDGWISITEFGFGFGWGGSDSSGGVTKPVVKEKDAESRLKLLEEQNKSLQSQINSANKGAGTNGKPAAKKEEGTLKPKDFSFSRTPSGASTNLMKLCRKVEEIPMVQLVCCRTAGVEVSGQGKTAKQMAKDAKIPFLRFIFEHVYLIKNQLSVTTAPVPSEEIEFIFQKVQMETVWTDNETGARVTGGSKRVYYDFGKKSDDAGGLLHIDD